MLDGYIGREDSFGMIKTVESELEATERAFRRVYAKIGEWCSDKNIAEKQKAMLKTMFCLAAAGYSDEIKMRNNRNGNGRRLIELLTDNELFRLKRALLKMAKDIENSCSCYNEADYLKIEDEALCAVFPEESPEITDRNSLPCWTEVYIVANGEVGKAVALDPEFMRNHVAGWRSKRVTFLLMTGPNRGCYSYSPSNIVSLVADSSIQKGFKPNHIWYHPDRLGECKKREEIKKAFQEGLLSHVSSEKGELVFMNGPLSDTPSLFDKQSIEACDEVFCDKIEKLDRQELEEAGYLMWSYYPNSDLVDKEQSGEDEERESELLEEFNSDLVDKESSGEDTQDIVESCKEAKERVEECKKELAVAERHFAELESRLMEKIKENPQYFLNKLFD